MSHKTTAVYARLVNSGLGSIPGTLLLAEGLALEGCAVPVAARVLSALQIRNDVMVGEEMVGRRLLLMVIHAAPSAHASGMWVVARRLLHQNWDRPVPV